MTRKKFIRWAAGIAAVVLLIFTAVSYCVYEALLPRVEVYRFHLKQTNDPEEFGTGYWVREGCIMSRNDRDEVLLFRARGREGIFGMEYYAEAIEGTAYRQKDGEVEISAPAMEGNERLICSTDKALASKTVVMVLNPEEME